MKKIHFSGETILEKGLAELCEQLGFIPAEDGFLIEAKTGVSDAIQADTCRCLITYTRRNRFFYALSVLAERWGEEFSERFESNFDRMGVMLDCSRNAVLNLSSVKRYLRQLALLGYDYLQLYTEDTYEIEEEPLFGYMRGRYSHAEIRELDDYARDFGIELMPCIQVLAHLDGIFRWERFKRIRDTANILLLRDEETYALIESMFRNVSKCFSSRRINIGMDEAWLLGSGKFLNLNGYVSRTELMKEHLLRVREIAKKYGFEIYMWNDMFFRIVNANDYDLQGEFPQEIRELVDESMHPIYWEYFHDDYEHYDRNVKNSLNLSANTVFAGAVLSWCSFAPDNVHAQIRMELVMRACREHGIKDILITSWGDDGCECSRFSILPSLLRYGEERFDRKTDMNRRSLSLFGYTFDEFMKIDYANRYADLEKLPQHQRYYGNASKYMLYNDPLLGFYDNNVPEDGDVWSRKNRDILQSLADRKSPFSYLFSTLAANADVLVEKSMLGKRLKRAYQAKDISALNQISEEIVIILEKLEIFAERYEYQWYRENKSFGWEIQETRIGGVERRLRHVRRLIAAYADGKIPQIEELIPERIDSDETALHGRYTACPCLWKTITSSQRHD